MGDYTGYYWRLAGGQEPPLESNASRHPVSGDRTCWPFNHLLVWRDVKSWTKNKQSVPGYVFIFSMYLKQEYKKKVANIFLEAKKNN